MILARCPACSTTFRVRPEQLRARQGRVRCGQCNHAFNALEALVEDDIHDLPAPSLAAPPNEPAVFVLEEKPAADITPYVEGFDAFDVWPPAETDGGETKAIPLPPIGHGAIEPIFEFGANLPEHAPLPSPDTDLPAADIFAPPGEGDAAPESPVSAALDDDRHEPGGEIPAEEWPPQAPAELAGIDLTAGIPEADIFATPTGEEIPHNAFSPADDTPAGGAPDDEAPTAAMVLPIPDGLPFDLDTPPTTSAAEAEADTDTPAVAVSVELPPPPVEHADTNPDAPVDFDTLIHTRDPGLAGEALAHPVSAAASLAPTNPSSVATRQDVEVGSDEGEPDTAEDASNTDEAREPALRQALWAAAATLLTLTVLAQGVLVFRNEIALSSPEMRPALESLCAGLGCELPLPRHAADIAIESSDIQPDAGREAYFTLHATLRNRAEFQQAWPHVEITLTDARDKALVRRVLAPDQWLPADAPKEAFPAKGEVAIRVAFEAPGVAAAGYRVYAFFP